MGCFTGDAVSPLSLPLFEKKQHNCYLKNLLLIRQKKTKMSIPQNKYVFKGGDGVCFRLRTNFAKVVPPPLSKGIYFILV